MVFYPYVEIVTVGEAPAKKICFLLCIHVQRNNDDSKASTMSTKTCVHLYLGMYIHVYFYTCTCTNVYTYNFVVEAMNSL